MVDHGAVDRGVVAIFVTVYGGMVLGGFYTTVARRVAAVPAAPTEPGAVSGRLHRQPDCQIERRSSRDQVWATRDDRGCRTQYLPRLTKDSGPRHFGFLCDVAGNHVST